MASKQDVPIPILKGSVIAGKFRVIKKIGAGSFGEVFSGIKIANREEVALKFEQKTPTSYQLLQEWKVYSKMQGGIGFPRLIWYGDWHGNYNVLVIERLGLSLDDLFNICGRRFTMKTVLLLADQMIDRLEYFHSKSLIHRDVKPNNFLMGMASHCSRVYLIDYGLCTRYRSANNHEHIKNTPGKGRLVGTARYASLNATRGRVQSRRDDMESLGFVLIYFLNGQLPWQKVQAATESQRVEKMVEKKLSTSIETLCKNLPQEFTTYFNYCRNLEFNAEPNYNYLRGILRYRFYFMNLRNDSLYDWTK